MSAAELLPCPFCGGKADWHNIGNEHTKSRSTKIWCSECRVTRNTGAIRHSLDWTKEHAFAAWNRRHTPSSPVSAPSPAGGVREALIDARDNGLIYWEPNTARGHVQKALMLNRINAALSSPATPVSEPSPSAGEMSCDEQLAEAQRLAANLGYMVVPDPVHADGEVHAPDFVMAMQPSLRALGFHAVPIATPPAPSGEARGKRERDAFERWAAKEWQNSSPPDNAWKGWIARAQLADRDAALSNPAPGHGEGGL